MYTSLTFVCALAAATSVLANPFPVAKRDPAKLLYLKDVLHPTSGAGVKERTVNECQVVNAVVGALKIVSKSAYPFCSTYINIPVITSTISATSTVTPNAVSVTTTLTPATVTATSIVTATSTVAGGTSTVYSKYTAAAAKDKRAAPTLPPYLKAFAAAQVSKACSCLSIPAKSTTVTTTVVTTIAASSTTVTSTAAVPTTTVLSTTTVTTTVASTVTVPALCNPTNFVITSGALSSSGNSFPNIVTKPGITDIGQCCAACFSTASCLSYYIYQGSCTLFVSSGTAPPYVGNAAQAALCPLGVGSDDAIFPDGVSAPASGDSAFHVGPCVREATPLV